jgi:hypothetical protein
MQTLGICKVMASSFWKQAPHLTISRVKCVPEKASLKYLHRQYNF